MKQQLTYFLFLFFLPFSFYGADHSVVRRVDKDDLNTSGGPFSITLEDPLSYEDGYLSSGDYASTRKLIVGLEYDRHLLSDITAQYDWSYTVTYDVYDDQGILLSSANQLSIDYDLGGGLSNNYKDIAVFTDNYSSYTVKVTNVTGVYSDGVNTTPTSTPWKVSQIPGDIQFNIEIKTERYRKLNPTDVPLVYYNTSTEEVMWSYVVGAEEYEVEWVYIDLESDFDFNTTDPEAPFKYKGASRVNTPWQTHKMDMIYQEGTLYFRVRAIGRYITGVGTDYSYIKYGDWGYWQSTNQTSAAIAKYTISSNNVFEAYKNWLYNASYAEGGKYQSAVSYYDGGLRSRQNVSYSTSNEITLVSEKKYDYEGRSSVNVSPGAIAGKDLHYQSGFNQVYTGTVYQIFDKEHFDGVSTTIPLSTNTGAAQYFSSDNPFTNNPYRDLIADAGGYVYTEAEYLEDGTGRVKKVSGIGDAFKMDPVNGDRATYFYYGNTNNAELARLFGNNTGLTSNYTKNMSVDANGQVSVSYLDKDNKVIATALAGDNPTNLIPLSVAQETITASFNQNNIHYPETNEYRSENVLLTVVPSQSYSFSYDVTGTVLQETFAQSGVNVTLCADCEYELEIYIEDADGNRLSFQQDFPTPVTTVTSIEDVIANAS